MADKLATLWTQHLRGKEKEDFELYVRNSTQLLTRLNDIIESEETKVWEEERSGEQYDAGWQFKQAHRNGKKEVLGLIKKLTQHLNSE